MLKTLLSQLDVKEGGSFIDPRKYSSRAGDKVAQSVPQWLISNVIALIIGVLGVAAVLAIIYGGILYVTAGADPEKAERGKRVIMYAVVGILIATAAYMIYLFVINGVQTGQVG